MSDVNVSTVAIASLSMPGPGEPAAVAVTVTRVESPTASNATTTDVPRGLFPRTCAAGASGLISVYPRSFIAAKARMNSVSLGSRVTVDICGAVRPVAPVEGRLRVQASAMTETKVRRSGRMRMRGMNVVRRKW